MQSRRLQYKYRWFCYFDILGFTELVRSTEVGSVIDLYEEAVAKLEIGAASKRSLGISYSWFSDTFIIFSRGNSLEEFTWLEQTSRLFFQRLILANIPVRGAISHGKLYSNLERNIFIGEALIEAYEYAEDQDWLGLLLAPSVFDRLDGTQLDVRRRYNYRHVPLQGVMRSCDPSRVFAYAFNNGTVNGANPFLTAIRAMKRRAEKPYHAKYERAESFIIKHRKDVVVA